MRRPLYALLAYTLLALVLTWPLIGHITTHVPGDGIDDPALAWNLWWVKHALVDRPQNPFDVRWLFHPIGINMAFYTLTVLNGILSIPLQAVGLVLASNLVLLSSFVLSGFGAYLLARALLHETTGYANSLAAFAAGFLYAFASSKMFYAALGQFNIASSQWLPFAVLYLWRATRPGGRARDARLAGLFLTLQAWAELTYASFLLVFAALLAAWRLWRGRRSRHTPIFTTRNLILVGLVTAIGLLPFLANMLPDLRAEGDFFSSGGGFADVFSADLLGYLVPTMHHPLLGDAVMGLPFPHDKGQQLYLGYSVLLLALAGLWRQRRRPAAAFWGASFLLFFLLTLGPTLRINGHDSGIPLPFALVERLPFFKGNRYPSRYSVLLVLSAAMLLAWGVQWLLTTRRPSLRPALAAALCGVILFEHLSIPLPLSDMRIPTIYQTIAQDAGDFAVLELPLAWRNGARVTGTPDVVIMFSQWYQTAHGKRLLGGNTSRNPAFKFQYFTEAPLINSLIAVETGHTLDADTVARDRDIAPAALATLRIRYVVAHLAALPAAAVEYVENVLPLEPVAEDGGIRLYRVQTIGAAPPAGLHAVASPLGQLALAEGWSPQPDTDGAVWAQRHEARLLLPLTAATRQIHLRLRAAGPGQMMTPVIHGHALAPIALAETWQDVVLDVPPQGEFPPLSDVRLRFRQTYPAAGQVAGAPVGTTGVATPVPILASSAGLDVGDFGHIYVNGVDVSPNGRGYNLAVIHPADGTVLAVAAFDTHLSPDASRQMQEFLAQIPDGMIVAGAAADEASLNLSEDAAQSLRALGAADSLRGRFRWSHAFIGVKGAAPGTALESVSETRPAHVFAGLPLSEPRVAAALKEIGSGE